MQPRSLRRAFLTLIGLAALAAAPAAFFDRPPVNAPSGLAVHGYDVVAYAGGTAAPGSKEHEHRWNGATWRFATAANRQAFAADPERYAPQFGGYCAWAVSRGYTADVDPEAFRIVDGKLYLNYSKSVQRQWERDVQGNIAKGRTNWPGVLQR